MTDERDWDDTEAAEKADWLARWDMESVAVERERCINIAEEAMNLCRAIEPGQHANGQRCSVCEKLRAIRGQQ